MVQHHQRKRPGAGRPKEGRDERPLFENTVVDRTYRYANDFLMQSGVEGGFHRKGSSVTEPKGGGDGDEAGQPRADTRRVANERRCRWQASLSLIDASRTRTTTLSPERYKM